jgi:MYXO-CTERM domain-containing protein
MYPKDGEGVITSGADPVTFRSAGLRAKLKIPIPGFSPYGILGIGEVGGELHVTEGQFDGAGRVWNLGAIEAGDRLSDGIEFASGVPYMANALLGVGENLYVTGHVNECFAGTAVWKLSSAGDMTESTPHTSGIGSACYLMEETAYINYCGDGVPRAHSDEECDSAGDSATCDTDCTLAACGDGYVNAEAGEDCDDGNTEGGDDCPATCKALLAPAANGESGASGSEQPGTTPANVDPVDGEIDEIAPASPTSRSAAAAGCSVTGRVPQGGFAAVLIALGLLAARRRKAQS